MMTKMTKKIFGGSLVALMALSLAGCANSAMPATKASHPQTTKVAQTPTVNKTSHTTSAAASSANTQQLTSAATGQTKASYAAQQPANTNTQQEKVVSQFTQASGVKQQAGQQYMVSQPTANGNYQIEVRDSKGDQNVSHLDGLYRYNPQTNAVQQMNMMTGEFEDK